jgi:hypothetical protein
MTGLQELREPRASILLRCEELQSYLEITKERLNQAALQLGELTNILLTRSAGADDQWSRPWLKELAVGQLVEDVQEVERRLSEVRTAAVGLGIPLPAESRAG